MTESAWPYPEAVLCTAAVDVELSVVLHPAVPRVSSIASVYTVTWFLVLLRIDQFPFSVISVRKSVLDFYVL